MNILSEFSQSNFYKQFEEYLQIRYPELYDSFTDEDKLDKFELVFMMGLRQAKNFQRMGISCNLLYNDHPMDKRMLSKLGFILFELKRIPSYPIVTPMQLGNTIKKVIGRDKRYVDRYRDLILSYSSHKPQFNKVDMSHLVSQFPEEYIVERSVW